MVPNFRTPQDIPIHEIVEAEPNVSMLAHVGNVDDLESLVVMVHIEGEIYEMPYTALKHTRDRFIDICAGIEADHYAQQVINESIGERPALGGLMRKDEGAEL